MKAQKLLTSVCRFCAKKGKKMKRKQLLEGILLFTCIIFFLLPAYSIAVESDVTAEVKFQGRIPDFPSVEISGLPKLPDSIELTNPFGDVGAKLVANIHDMKREDDEITAQTDISLSVQGAKLLDKFDSKVELFTKNNQFKFELGGEGDGLRGEIRIEGKIEDGIVVSPVAKVDLTYKQSTLDALGPLSLVTLLPQFPQEQLAEVLPGLGFSGDVAGITYEVYFEEVSLDIAEGQSAGTMTVKVRLTAGIISAEDILTGKVELVTEGTFMASVRFAGTLVDKAELKIKGDLKDGVVVNPMAKLEFDMNDGLLLTSAPTQAVKGEKPKGAFDENEPPKGNAPKHEAENPQKEKPGKSVDEVEKPEGSDVGKPEKPEMITLEGIVQGVSSTELTLKNGQHVFLYEETKIRGFLEVGTFVRVKAQKIEDTFAATEIDAKEPEGKERAAEAINTAQERHTRLLGELQSKGVELPQAALDNWAKGLEQAQLALERGNFEEAEKLAKELKEQLKRAKEEVGARDEMEHAKRALSKILNRATKKGIELPQEAMNDVDALLQQAMAQIDAGNFEEAELLAEQAQERLDALREDIKELRKDAAEAAADAKRAAEDAKEAEEKAQEAAKRAAEKAAKEAEKVVEEALKAAERAEKAAEKANKEAQDAAKSAKEQEQQDAQRLAEEAAIAAEQAQQAAERTLEQAFTAAEHAAEQARREAEAAWEGAATSADTEVELAAENAGDIAERTSKAAAELAQKRAEKLAKAAEKAKEKDDEESQLATQEAAEKAVAAAETAAQNAKAHALNAHHHAEAEALDARKQPVKGAQVAARRAAVAARMAQKQAEKAKREAELAAKKAERAASQAARQRALEAEKAARETERVAKEAEKAAKKAGKEATDLNDDGLNDISDLVRVGLTFGKTSKEAGKPLISDVNGDEIVNIIDLLFVALGLSDDGVMIPSLSSDMAEAPAKTLRSSPVRVWLKANQKVHNNTFKLDVMVDSKIDLSGFQFDLCFDPRVVDVVEIEEGSYLRTHGGFSFWLAPKMDSRAGKLMGAASTRLGSDGVSGSGVLATLTLRTKEGVSRQPEVLKLVNLKLVDYQGVLIPSRITSQPVHVTLPLVPKRSKLQQNYPNPFNPETWIPFVLSSEASVEIMIYNASGQLIRRLDLGNKPAGWYISKDKAAYWDGTNAFFERVASGLYFYTIHAGDFTATRKMITVK